MAESQRVDAVIIGAGVAGLYQLYRLREQGLHVRVFDAASEVGGTWYWNRYPGARTDSLSHEYQYWFSDELLDEWNWQERFPSQSEIERYLNHVADRFDLRRDITFNTRVDAAHWDEATGQWKISTDTGETVAARFLITCLGPLSAPLVPPFEGHETFTGEIVHTARWPREGVDLAGKRVGVIGTGATGIQVIQTIAAEVEHLTVFQRTANYALPMHNPTYDDNDRAALRARYPAIRSQVHHTFAGFSEDLDERDAADLSPEERRHTLERLYEDGSLKLWIGGFKEVFFDEAINEEISEFVRERIRARIDDPAMAEKLVPTDHGFGTRRVPLETNYFEAYNRDNVDLVDIKAAPIECFTEAGIRTADTEYPLDVIILATGFDAGTGGLTGFDIRGRDGVALADQWSQEIRTTMGLQIHGYPNLFTTSAPFAPASAFCNAPTCLQQQVDWIADCIAYLERQGRRTIEPTPEMEQSWIDHHDELAAMTLIPRTKSWYTGANVAGKQQRLLGYIGGVNAYGQACEDLKAKGYEGFAIA
ncbi:NAD(P)/FAD-dependent oxidoreductase [Spectribacter hydrogenoxidans]|uniref:NAD(P)/FAD-dependent oxidoreductase n=1 Tax=Spectribacter hydrogenoxidans TaxID=3075608 RepID=A0ABU3BYW0_9GAMM|nr:NAD(P)/FAD-dependent oxidoreductase [Salinisphaera sp. W335]MDT0634488.1 NAD(P)/FAD-dependent oxidoreductase [Salinisphaera sp. W335]